MNFIIMFMGSPEYIRNPYLRAKMVEVLNCWMPRRRLFDNHCELKKLDVSYFFILLCRLF